MFKAFHGSLGDEFLTDEHDPAGMKRTLRRELDLFGNASEPVATYMEDEEICIKVAFNITEEGIIPFRDRYRDFFETGELEEMCDIVEDFVASSQEVAEAIEPEDDGEEAFGRYLAQQAIIAASVAVAQSLQRLFYEEIDNRLHSAAVNGTHAEEFGEDRSFLGENDDDGWPEPDNEEDEEWNIGTVMDPDGDISENFSASAIGDDDDLASNANSVVIDEEILHEAMTTVVNMIEVGQSFDAIHGYLDKHLAAQGIPETSPAYQKAHVSLMHAVVKISKEHKGTMTLERLLELREHPDVVRILAPLVGDEALCCFSSVFHDVAQSALYNVEKFSDMVDAKVFEEEADNQRIEDIAFAYAVELVTRNGLA